MLPMKLIAFVIASVLCVLALQAQTPQCIQTDFSGEATQSHEFRQELGDGLTFTIKPMKFSGHPEKAWFRIIVLRKGASLFVFNPSDTNWAVAVGGLGQVLIGGASVDLRKSLQDRSRYLFLPLSVDEKERARKAANSLYEATTPEQEMKAVAALNKVHMAHAEFEITDYELGGGAPPISVESVKFHVKITFPGDFLISGELPVTLVNCPAIPAEVIASLKDPHRH